MSTMNDTSNIMGELFIDFFIKKKRDNDNIAFKTSYRRKDHKKYIKKKSRNS